ncbi:hypothetical protein [Maricaulis sp.]|uniref:hypothetical protein n=1 Tax=Maricaulis sp. TaxID=1486257 RepID=UPI003A918FE0|tara:strand:+ start:8970 stop:9509 length:540 start_codon:yes stop_codon:yes gene_type:complete
MTQEPEKTEPPEPAERPETAKTPRRDPTAWYPYFLQYEAGKTAREIAGAAGVTPQSVYRAMSHLRRLPAAELAERRETALRRRRLEAEAEYLLGDPAAATKMATAYVALRRAEHEERTAMMETRHAATPGENKEAKLSDAEVELLRADLRRRLFPRDTGNAAEVEVRTAGPDCPGRPQG